MRKLLLTVSLLLSQVVNSSATSASSLDSLAQQIACSNPDVKTILLQGAEQAESLLAENTLADPTAEMEHLWGQGPLGNKLTVGISQEFQLPGIIKSRKRMASLINKESEAERQILFLEKRNEARQLLVRAIYGMKLTHLCDSICKLTHERSLILTDMLKRGDATRLDAYKAAVEATEARRQSEAAIRDLNEIRSAIDELAGGTKINLDMLPTTLKIAPPEPLDTYLNDITESNSVFSALDRLRESSAHERLTLVKAERWPTINLGYIYNHEVGETYQGFSVGVTLPVYSRKHKKEAARLTSQQLTLSDHTRLQSAIVSLQQSYETASSLWDELKMIQELMTDDKDLDLLNRMLSVNTLTRPDYLSEIADLINIRRAHIEAERDYMIAVTSLKRYRDL